MLQVPAVPTFSQACSFMVLLSSKKILVAFRRPATRVCQRVVPLVWNMLVGVVEVGEGKRTYVVKEICGAMEVDSCIVGPLEFIDDCAILID